MAEAATLDEIKDRIRKRVGRRSPFHLMDSAEAGEVLDGLDSLDPDAWAEAWSKPGARWENTAREAEEKGQADEAKEAYFQASAYYGAGRHPFPSSPGKQEAYRKTIETYLAAARYFDPPLERIALPLRDKEVVGYLRLPAKRPAPVIMHWGGIDNWKEERHSFVESMLAEGWGCFIMDSPGTGESPVLASDTAHEVYSVALDHLVTRPEVDPGRIAVLGASFGGYWSTKMAHVEPERLRAAVNWGGGIHGFFQPEWQQRSRNASSYLFDLIEARARLFGKKTFEELMRGHAHPVPQGPGPAGQALRPHAPGQRQGRPPSPHRGLLHAAGVRQPQGHAPLPRRPMGESPDVFPDPAVAAPGVGTRITKYVDLSRASRSESGEPTSDR